MIDVHIIQKPWHKKSYIPIEIDPQASRKNFRIGLAVFFIGLFIAGFGFYDLSIWNQSQSHWYGLMFLIVGFIITFVGIIGIAAGFPDLFSDGSKGI